MPLIDQNGNKLRLKRPPHYDVKIVASRREIVWSEDHEEEAETERKEVEKNSPENDPKDGEISVEIEKSHKIKPESAGRNKKQAGYGYHKKPSISRKKVPGKLLKSKSDDEISRRKISTSSFTILSTTSNNSTKSARKGKSSEDSRTCSLDYNNPTELDRAVAADMAAVSSRTMDLMIIEMRKLDRDRDRVLTGATVETILDKYHIPLKPACRDVLLGKFEDNKDFVGMINYEELVRFLEERRLEGGRERVSKVENFILFETEHNKARYKRNKSWTNSMENRLVLDLKKDFGAGGGDDGSLTLNHIAERLHEKDTYGHNHVSSPHLRSVLRGLTLAISPKPLSGIMKASDLDNKGSHSIPVVLDIMSKVL